MSALRSTTPSSQPCHRPRCYYSKVFAIVLVVVATTAASAVPTPRDFGGGVAGFDAAIHARAPCVVAERQRVVRATVGSNVVSGAALTGAERAPVSVPEKAPIKRYDVASVSFQRVETPFIIGLWIFCASLAKIGEWRSLFWFCVVLFRHVLAWPTLGGRQTRNF